MQQTPAVPTPTPEPEVPATPETPTQPVEETPVVPEQPADPVVPETPAEPTPEVPVTPTDPTPDAPATPEDTGSKLTTETQNSNENKTTETKDNKKNIIETGLKTNIFLSFSMAVAALFAGLFALNKKKNQEILVFFIKNSIIDIERKSGKGEMYFEKRKEEDFSHNPIRNKCINRGISTCTNSRNG